MNIQVFRQTPWCIWQPACRKKNNWKIIKVRERIIKRKKISKEDNKYENTKVQVRREIDSSHGLKTRAMQYFLVYYRPEQRQLYFSYLISPSSFSSFGSRKSKYNTKKLELKRVKDSRVSVVVPKNLRAPC